MYKNPKWTLYAKTLRWFNGLSLWRHSNNRQVTTTIWRLSKEVCSKTWLQVTENLTCINCKDSLHTANHTFTHNPLIFLWWQTASLLTGLPFCGSCRLLGASCGPVELKETLLQFVIHKSQIKMIRNTTDLLLVILVSVAVITVNTVAQYPALSCTQIQHNIL